MATFKEIDLSTISGNLAIKALAKMPELKEAKLLVQRAFPDDLDFLLSLHFEKESRGFILRRVSDMFCSGFENEMATAINFDPSNEFSYILVILGMKLALDHQNANAREENPPYVDMEDEYRETPSLADYLYALSLSLPTDEVSDDFFLSFERGLRFAVTEVELDLLTHL